MKHWQKKYLDSVSNAETEKSKKNEVINSFIKELKPMIDEYKALADYTKDPNAMFKAGLYSYSDIVQFIEDVHKFGELKNIKIKSPTSSSIVYYVDISTGIKFSSIDIKRKLEDLEDDRSYKIFLFYLVLFISVFAGLLFFN